MNTKTWNHKGQALTLREVAVVADMPYQTLAGRVRRKPLIKLKELVLPVDSSKSHAKLHEHNGKEKTLQQWADDLGVLYNTFHSRFKQYGLQMAIEIGSGRMPSIRGDGNSKIDLYQAHKTDPDYEEKNLINSLRRMGLRGEELKQQALKRRAWL